MVQWNEDEVEYLKLNYSTEPRKNMEEILDRDWGAIRKKAERLGVGRHSQYDLIDSVRSAPSPNLDDDAFNHYIVGFVDGEGTFTIKRNDGRPLQHRFAIELTKEDRSILERIHNYLKVGTISDLEARKESHKPTVVYSVQNFGELICVILPFFQEYEPRAKKRNINLIDGRPRF